MPNADPGGLKDIHYLALGHLTQDLTATGPRLGGTVAFAALTAQACGYRPGVFTACAQTLDLSPLNEVTVVRQATDASTTFENIYTPAGRQQFLRATATPLALNQIPPTWQQPLIVHLAPLAQEIALPLAPAWQGAFVGLTPQGWLRQWDATGCVHTLPTPPAHLPTAQAIVLSLEDLHGDWAYAVAWTIHTPVLVVTQGAEGCTVFAQGASRHIPAFPQTAEVDPTGAGDVFAAAFFVHLYETADPWAAARFANAVAGRSVTRPGLLGVPTADEVSLCHVQAKA